VAATEAGISVGSMHFGKLHLAGPVPSTQQDGLAVALLADVPGLHWVFEEASKDGDARARENFRGASLQRDDVVLSVGGAVPYVVLANGDKQGRANPR
jgi:hypothetical protein